MDSLNTRNVIAVSAAIVVSLLGSVALGIVGNNAADRSHERVAVACVQSGGQWRIAENTDTFECVR